MSATRKFDLRHKVCLDSTAKPLFCKNQTFRDDRKNFDRTRRRCDF